MGLVPPDGGGYTGMAVCASPLSTAPTQPQLSPDPPSPDWASPLALTESPTSSRLAIATPPYPSPPGCCIQF